MSQYEDYRPAGGGMTIIEIVVLIICVVAVSVMLLDGVKHSQPDESETPATLDRGGSPGERNGATFSGNMPGVHA